MRVGFQILARRHAASSEDPGLWIVGASALINVLIGDVKYWNGRCPVIRASSGPADTSASGSLRGCPCLRCRADGLGRNLESILVHIESLLPVQAFDELTCRLTDRSRKTRGLHFDPRFHCSFSSISIAKLHFKRFHTPNLPFLTMKTETRSRTTNHVGLRTTVTFSSDDVFDS